MHARLEQTCKFAREIVEIQANIPIDNLNFKKRTITKASIGAPTLILQVSKRCGIGFALTSIDILEKAIFQKIKNQLTNQKNRITMNNENNDGPSPDDLLNEINSKSKSKKDNPKPITAHNARKSVPPENLLNAIIVNSSSKKNGSDLMTENYQKKFEELVTNIKHEINRIHDRQDKIECDHRGLDIEVGLARNTLSKLTRSTESHLDAVIENLAEFKKDVSYKFENASIWILTFAIIAAFSATYIISHELYELYESRSASQTQEKQSEKQIAALPSKPNTSTNKPAYKNTSKRAQKKRGKNKYRKHARKNRRRV